MHTYAQSLVVAQSYFYPLSAENGKQKLYRSTGTKYWTMLVFVNILMFVTTYLCLQCFSPPPHIHADSAQAMLPVLWTHP